MIDPNKIKKRKNQETNKKGEVKVKRGRRPKPFVSENWVLYIDKRVKDNTIDYVYNRQKEAKYTCPSDLITFLLKDFLAKN